MGFISVSAVCIVGSLYRVRHSQDIRAQDTVCFQKNKNLVVQFSVHIIAALSAGIHPLVRLPRCGVGTAKVPRLSPRPACQAESFLSLLRWRVPQAPGMPRLLRVTPALWCVGQHVLDWDPRGFWAT